MGTNCAPLLADICLYSYEAEFIQSLLSTGKKQLASRINFTYRYIDEVYKEPRVWELPGPDVSRWILDQRHDREQHFCFLPGFTSVDREGRSTSYFHLWKRDDLNFQITKFPFLSSNIPASPAYVLFISQLIRCSRACSSYEFLLWGWPDFHISFSNRDMPRNAWNRSWIFFYGRYGDLINQYEVPLSRMMTSSLTNDDILLRPISRIFSRTIYFEHPSAFSRFCL